MNKLIALLAILTFSIAVNAENITKLSYITAPSTIWTYSATGDTITANGIKDKAYPIAALPSETYLISAPIAVSNYATIGINCNYYVETSATHALAIDVLSLTGDILYTHTFTGTPNVEMAIGGSISKLSFAEELVQFKIKLSGAYNDSEIAHINELEIYGTLKDWSERTLILLPHVYRTNNLTINWATFSDATSYKISFKQLSENDAQVTTLDAKSAKEQSFTISNINDHTDYEYQVTAVNAAGQEIASKTIVFNATTGIEPISTSPTSFYISGNILMLCAITNEPYSIHNILGNLIFTGFSHLQKSIELPAGIYILTINGRSHKIRI